MLSSTAWIDAGLSVHKIVHRRKIATFRLRIDWSNTRDVVLTKFMRNLSFLVLYGMWDHLVETRCQSDFSLHYRRMCLCILHNEKLEIISRYGWPSTVIFILKKMIASDSSWLQTAANSAFCGKHWKLFDSKLICFVIAHLTKHGNLPINVSVQS